MKIDCIKTALADGIGIASTEFGCTKFYSLAKWHCISKQRVWVHTQQTHLLGSLSAPLKPQKERMVIIEKRTERIKFWLTDKELKQIDRKAGKLGMNRSEYIRHIIANCKLVHTPSIDYESYYNRLKCISDEINHHLIVLNQIGTLDEPRFNNLCEDAVKTAKELSDELTEKLDIEIEKSKEVNT